MNSINLGILLVILTLDGELWSIKRELWYLKILEIVAESKDIRISMEGIASKLL